MLSPFLFLNQLEWPPLVKVLLSFELRIRAQLLIICLTVNHFGHVIRINLLSQVLLKLIGFRFSVQIELLLTFVFDWKVIIHILMRIINFPMVNVFNILCIWIWYFKFGSSIVWLVTLIPDVGVCVAKRLRSWGKFLDQTMLSQIQSILRYLMTLYLMLWWLSASFFRKFNLYWLA